ncbi:MAG: DUF411 domain-containing protein [Gemmatimonadaceae bacterium]
MKVPGSIVSCHTALVNGIGVEGHVTIDVVAKLAMERPAGVKGVGVRDPLGAPGMEDYEKGVIRSTILDYPSPKESRTGRRASPAGSRICRPAGWPHPSLLVLGLPGFRGPPAALSRLAGG